MPVPLLGFVVAQLGLRAIPVLLRSGQYAMRYIVTTPGAKGKAMQELGKRVLGKNAIVDDVAKLTSKKADNVVSKIIDPKNLSASERTTLMNTTYKDSSKLLQSQKSYPSNAKLASDIEKGLNPRAETVVALARAAGFDVIEAILAHELGHFHHKHVRKRMIGSFVFSLLSLALLGYLIEQNWFFLGLGVSTPSNHAALVIFSLTLPVFSFFITPFSNLISRKH